MTEEEVKQKRNDHWQKTGGLAFTRKDVKSWLIDHRNAQIVAMGGVPDPTWEPPASTVGNYYHLFTTDEEVALTQRAQGQTNTRFAASNSEKAAVCLIVGEAYGKYRIGEPPASHPMRKNPGTAGAQELEALVSKYYGDAPAYTIHPANVNNTDDTRLYVLKGAMDRGKAHGGDEWAAHQAGLNVQQNSPKVRDDLPVVAAGLSVKPTFTFSAGGFVAPFYVTVYGLTERELPRAKTESGIRIVEMKGFCVGSSVGKCNAMQCLILFAFICHACCVPLT